MTSGTTEMSTYVEWDVRTWSRALDFWSGHGKNLTKSAKALELGGRGGGLSLWLADQGVGHIICSDLDGPLPAARSLHATRGYDKRKVSYEAIDATQIPFHDHFDVVVFKSVLGSLGAGLGAQGQVAAVNSIYDSLRPGGQLWFAENLTASPLHELARRRFVDWGSRWRYVTVAEMLNMLSPFSDVQWDTVGLIAAFGRTEAQRRYLAGLDRRVLEKWSPRSWRYVMVGVATK